MPTNEPDSRFDEFMAVVRRLRKDCPWDREQTHESISHALIEEAYEVVESIDHRNMEELKKELGDLLIHVGMHAVMAEEVRAFSIEDVVEHVKEKLIRRHPHVFGDTKVDNAHEVKKNWERLKMDEGRTSHLDGVPRELPALLRATRLQEKASKVGFDWKNKADVWSKVEEEIRELKAAEESSDQERIEAELGDLLFAIANYARFLQVNSEFALRRAAAKFLDRFQKIEQELRERGTSVGEATLEEMDALWDKHKESER